MQVEDGAIRPVLHASSRLAGPGRSLRSLPTVRR